MADRVVDWDAFDKLSRWIGGLPNFNIRQLIGEGTIALQKAHDDLEKPVRELGVIDRKTKDTSTSKKSSTREYTKLGGEEALSKDFKKFQGEAVPKERGIEVNTLPNGSKVVMRPKSADNKIPTLEIQPKSTGSKFRIKIRYP